jgi:hypothetical protein
MRLTENHRQAAQSINIESDTRAFLNSSEQQFTIIGSFLERQQDFWR